MRRVIICTALWKTARCPQICSSRPGRRSCASQARLEPRPDPPGRPRGCSQRGRTSAAVRRLICARCWTRFCPLPRASLPVGDAPRSLAGVSLSGLFAVYAAHCTDAFDRICSISGSLWYDGFLDFMARTPVSPAVQRAYLSVGKPREKRRQPAHAPGGGLHPAGRGTPAAAGGGRPHGDQPRQPFCRRGRAPAQGACRPCWKNKRKNSCNLRDCSCFLQKSGRSVTPSNRRDRR